MPGPGQRPINIQDSFLFQSLKEARPLDVLLTTGKALNGGKMKRFDRYAIVLGFGVKEVLVYKHAIAMITDVEGAEARDSRPPAVRRPPEGAPRRTATQWAR